MQIEFAARALKALEDISDFTETTWGKAVSQRYIGSLLASLERLKVFPDNGHEVEIGPLRYRRLIHESHSIYYRIDGSRILVVGILHVRQDPFRHLT
ncbi:MAG: type II toxin-antitoxin system RelE/ParE family toxin [Alphaproteobacteria bacterium]|nr:type II toxin-antitoxin system RelE/ParE family toxin [Alphaproteobacteria bacterium]